MVLKHGRGCRSKSLEMMEIMSGVVTAMRESDEREFQEKNR